MRAEESREAPLVVLSLSHETELHIDIEIDPFDLDIHVYDHGGSGH